MNGTRRQGMNRWKRWVAAAGVALGATLSMAGRVEAQVNSPAVDPAALRILKSMTDYMDGLKLFSVAVRSEIEDLHSSGHRVDYELHARVTIKRPNKLLAARTGETMSQTFFYDGKILTLYDPVEKVYATWPAPDTVEGAVTLARETIGIVFPAADLAYRNAYPLLTKDLTLAVVVGKAVIDGSKCDHLLFSHPGADFQVWVEEGKRPLPRKYVVTETDTPARLSVGAVLSEWNESPAVSDAQFEFVPPQGTSQTRFISYGTTSQTGR
jgi:hypothetical protein